MLLLKDPSYLSDGFLLVELKCVLLQSCELLHRVDYTSRINKRGESAYSRGFMPGQWSSIRSSRLHVHGCIVPHLGCCVEEVLSGRGWSASSVLVWFSMILVRNPWTLVSQSLHSSQGKSLRIRPYAWLWRSTTCSDWRGRSFSLIALEQPPSPASRPLRCKSVEVIDLHRTEVNLFPNDVRLDFSSRSIWNI